MNDDNLKVEFNEQLNGAKNTFFGLLQGINNKINIDIPDYIYHYTSSESFELIMKSETLRLYTIENFIDKNERNLKFNVEDRIRGNLVDNINNTKHDITSIIKNELSNEFVFIQSNTSSNKNKYLWNNYANNQKGVCLKLSTKKFIDYVNSKIDEYELLPDYYKCCYIQYDIHSFNKFLEIIFDSINNLQNDLKNNLYLAWFFLIEYWRSFFKNENYKPEEEIRFIISDNYALFLFIYHLLLKWKVAKSNNPEKISKLFLNEYNKRKIRVYSEFKLNTLGNKKYLNIPLYEILDSVIIGSDCKLSKEFISKVSDRKIKKSNIIKSSKI
ncbi:DUF2971 domain-containing protein [Arcobacter sp.]|uniref:DUF2971 domain-containing protein n=1 Tax=unclassified Arcobacter TaxID=2593671 RepID=UPI003B0002F1